MAFDNQFKPFATSLTANVISQAAYEALPALSEGFVAGVAESAQLNKAWRQSSFMASVLAQLVGEQLDQDVLDNGDQPASVVQLRNALIALINATTGGFTTGDIKYTSKTAADTGFVMLNDGTIGNAGSGASTRANADTQPLYLHLWNTFPQTTCPVIGGRGASALADFNASKQIRLPPFAGRVLGVSGTGAGLTARDPGATPGSETVSLTPAQGPKHWHTAVTQFQNGTGSAAANFNPPIGGGAGFTESGGPALVGADLLGTKSAGGNAPSGGNVLGEGPGNPHENMQPTIFMQAMIKL